MWIGGGEKNVVLILFVNVILIVGINLLVVRFIDNFIKLIFLRYLIIG